MAEEKTSGNENKLLNISQKSFISVLILLVVLMAVSVVLTYVIPKGAYQTNTVNGEDRSSPFLRDSRWRIQ